MNLNIKEIHAGLLNKEFSAADIVKECYKVIKKKDKDIHAFISLTEDLALIQADQTDKLISDKKEIPLLSGVPSGIKDNIMVKGARATCGSKILENYTAVYDAAVVRKLKDQGAIILGKTNLDEFAMGSSTENSAFFPTKNPYDLKRVPGGSSGGSAAAVAAGYCSFALGSDTGGSIRQPASFCSVVGLKPTYGAVSRYGLAAFASSLDQIGPLAKTAEDAEIVFNAIKGKDKKDFTSAEASFNSPELRIGIPKEYFAKGLEKEVEEIVMSMAKKIESKGAKIEEVSLPLSKYAIPVYYLVATSEASANLARYDGLRYGLKDKSKAKDLIDVYLENRGENFGQEVRRRIMLGTFALSSGYYDAYYLKAQKARALIKRDFQSAFKKVDALFSPVSPHTAFKLGEKVSDPLSMYLEDIYTVSANLAGIPALSLPAGFANKLPVGLQIMGNYFQEEKIFQIAKLLEE